MLNLTDNKFECCGCKACAEICPKQCISFKKGEDTFLYPYIETSICINCNLCEKVCPMNNPWLYTKTEPVYNVGVNQNSNIVKTSSSGGAFYTIATEKIKQKWYVVGCKFDNDLNVVMDISNTNNGIKDFQKSKYIQSDTNGCFTKVLNKLNEGQNVLFTGTPCQVSAMRNFIWLKRRSYKGILFIDILCHGVPSYDIFKAYVIERENVKNKKIINFEFRNKKPINGVINSRSVRIVYDDNEEELLTIKNCTYLKGYHKRLFYRKSCYKCPFATTYRSGDITLADAWRIQNIYKSLNPVEGVSLISFNSDKGKVEFYDLLDREMCLKEVSAIWAYNSNDTFRGPTKEPANRYLFFDKYKNDGFSKAVNIALYVPLYLRIVRKIKRILNI